MGKSSPLWGGGEAGGVIYPIEVPRHEDGGGEEGCEIKKIVCFIFCKEYYEYRRYYIHFGSS